MMTKAGFLFVCHRTHPFPFRLSMYCHTRMQARHNDTKKTWTFPFVAQVGHGKHLASAPTTTHGFDALILA